MLRGREVSRIEGFSDAVFGFALTLLVVSLEVPESFADLVGGSLLGVGPGISDGMTPENSRMLMTVYSGGFVGLFATFMLLNWNVYRQRASLGLSTLAAYDARASIMRHGISVAIGRCRWPSACSCPSASWRSPGSSSSCLGPHTAPSGTTMGVAVNGFKPRW